MFLSIIHRVLLVSLCLVTLAAKANEPKQTTLTCKVNIKTGSGVFLYKLENGEAVSLGFRRADEISDTCMFSFPQDKEGIYFLRKAGVHAAEFRHVLYLKPGDNKQINIYLSALSIDYDSCIVTNPNSETVYLQQWNDRFNAIVKAGTIRTNREEFVSAYDQLLKDVKVLKEKAVPSNPYFKRLFSAKLDAEVQFLKAGAFFYFGERMNSAYDSAKFNAGFYRSIKEMKFCDTNLLQSEHGLDLVNFVTGYRLLQQYGTQEKMLAAAFNEKVSMICSEVVRSAFVAARMIQVRSYEQFKKEIQPYRNLFTTVATKAAYQAKLDELTVFAKGAKAYNFKLEDTKGKMVSLSDFKGKIVVLDIWAMWCAPCLAEKPFFQQTEEAFADRNDIIFLGISHDGLSKKGPWKEFVARKGWKNVEMIANYNESVGKYYKLTDIPRFMIFDKEGKIVTVDAPRPSDPSFKKLIEETLENNSK